MKLAEFLDTAPSQNPNELSPLDIFVLKHFPMGTEIMFLSGTIGVLHLMHEYGIPEDLADIIRGEE